MGQNLNNLAIDSQTKKIVNIEGDKFIQCFGK